MRKCLNSSYPVVHLMLVGFRTSLHLGYEKLLGSMSQLLAVIECFKAGVFLV